MGGVNSCSSDVAVFVRVAYRFLLTAKAMEASDAQSQIKQMISFIANEAQEKAKDIQKKGEEEFSIEVHRLITEQKEKIRQSYEKRVKQIETKYAIAKSMAINKKRLEK